MKSSNCKFVSTAVGAFPPDCEALACEAGFALSALIDPGYQSASTTLMVRVHTIRIPQRVHFREKRHQNLHHSSALELVIQCLLTRSTDGYERQGALQSVGLFSELLTRGEPVAFGRVDARVLGEGPRQDGETVSFQCGILV
jgi:hypothetical protein